MKYLNVVILMLALTAAMTTTPPLLLPSARAQQQHSPPDQQDETIRIGTAEVMLDAVVRDKKGRPVQDLKIEDLEIYEDGVRQDVRSLRLVKRDDAAAGGASAAGPEVAREKEAAAAARSDSLGAMESGVSAVALVFDRLSPQARSLAHKAALSYVDANQNPDSFVGVFAIDLSLRVLQRYSKDAALLKQAIDRAGALSTSSFGSSTEQVRGISERLEAIEGGSAGQAAATSSGTAAAGAAGAAIGENAVEQRFAEMTMRMLETFEAMERDQQGYATTNGLLAVTQSLRRLPGRKAIIFFSEGLSIPPAVQSHFRSVISNANRANVSIYTVDAAGLRVESANAETRREIVALGRRRLQQAATGREDTSGPMTRSLERNEDLLRLNPHSGLGQLADETGGFLISETNNLSERLRRVDEDLHTYYALSYVPKNQNYDGRFRQLEVRLKRPGLDVQSRKGYYAINAAFASPVLPYEVPALAVLGGGGTRRPDSFPVRARGMDFPESNGRSQVPVLVAVPTKSFTFSADNEKKLYATDFSIVALIKNQSQQVVGKLSNQYQLSGPLAKLEEAKRGEILFYRTADLEPGRYTIDVVAYDALGGRTSVRTSDVEVLAGAAGELRLSSIVIIERVEKIAAADQNAAENPFTYQEVLIYPNLGEPLSRAKHKQLPFFFTVYAGAPKNAPALKLTIEILQGATSFGKVAGNLPPADAAGRIKYANALPIEKFPPGAYELKIVVSDGRGSVTRSARFVIEP